ncbi:cilia-and flagella-associated protein 96-like [Corticium candelabrum]|uniref:cilia-and flagella-associated protein 96-like n=1 Tax=Corticium candelabrum TaxID=121492 RepID=UPI002E2630CE|nr:cilia-and flagella-associated protein 96-like [Corticium candelabrum]
MSEKKSDMERMGLFSEVGYTTIGDPYVPPNSKPFHELDPKCKPFAMDGSKTRSSTQAGYFSKAFDRIMQGEAFSDLVKLRRQHKISEAKKNIGSAFVPSSGTKMMSGLGSHYGTLGGSVKAFSPVKRDGRTYKSPGKNFNTTPAKKGTGYGYVNVTIGQPLTYTSEQYERAKDLRKSESETHKKKMVGSAFKLNCHPMDTFDINPYRSDKPLPPLKEAKQSKEAVKPFKPSSPAKAIGGMKAGTFEPYPTYSSDPYIKNPAKRIMGDEKKKIFTPPAVPKSRPTKSIVAQNVVRRMNRGNFKAVGPVS